MREEEQGPEKKSHGATLGDSVVISRAQLGIQGGCLTVGTRWSLGHGLHTTGLWGPGHMPPAAPALPTGSKDRTREAKGGSALSPAGGA